MVDEAIILDNAVTTKHQFANDDVDEDLQIKVVREKIRVWNKIFRISQDGTEVAVVLPYDTLIEPLYSTDDIDMTVDKCGIHDSDNEYFRLYSDANGNYKYLQSKIVTWQEDRSVRSVTMEVESEYEDGTNALEGISIEVYNGNEWIHK